MERSVPETRPSVPACGTKVVQQANDLALPACRERLHNEISHPPPHPSTHTPLSIVKWSNN